MTLDRTRSSKHVYHSDYMYDGVSPDHTLIPSQNDPTSSLSRNSVSIPLASALYAGVVAGRLFKGHCKDNQRTYNQYGVNPKMLGILERSGIFSVEIIETSLDGCPSKIMYMPGLFNSKIQVVESHPNMVGKTVEHLKGKKDIERGIAELNAIAKELLPKAPSANPPVKKDPPISKAPGPALPESFLLENSKEFPIHQFENHPDQTNSNDKLELTGAPYLDVTNHTLTQEAKDLRQTLDESGRVRNDPKSSAKQKQKALDISSEAMDKFLSKTRLLKSADFKGPLKDFFDACERIIKQAETRRLQSEKLVSESRQHEQRAKDYEAKADALTSSENKAEQAEYDAKALAARKLAIDKYREGLKGGILHGIYEGALKELMRQSSAFPNTLRNHAALSGVGALCDWAEGKVNAQQAAVDAVVNTTAGTIVEVGASVLHAATVGGVSAYSEDLAGYVPGVGTCVQTIHIGYAIYMAKDATEALTNTIWAVCESSAEMTASYAATSILCSNPVTAPFAPLGPALGRAAWRGTKATWRYFLPSDREAAIYNEWRKANEKLVYPT